MNLDALTDGQLFAVALMVIGVVLLAISVWGLWAGYGADE